MTEIKKKKSDKSRACADVPSIWLDTIKKWNEGKIHQIKISAIIVKAVEAEYDKIKNEVEPEK